MRFNLLELTYQQLLLIASWPSSPEVDAFKAGLGKLVAKGELVQVVNEKKEAA